MPHGKTAGMVDPKFDARIKELRELAQKTAEQFKTGTGFRPWSTPKSMADKDLMFVPGLHEPAWDRDNINRTYSESVLRDPGPNGDQSGTVGDLIGMKWQADFMATEERAFRFRHASMARCAALAHGRLKGHGMESGSVFTKLRESVDTFIKAGSN